MPVSVVSVSGVLATPAGLRSKDSTGRTNRPSAAAPQRIATRSTARAPSCWRTAWI